LRRLHGRQAAEVLAPVERDCVSEVAVDDSRYVGYVVPTGVLNLFEWLSGPAFRPVDVVAVGILTHLKRITGRAGKFGEVASVFVDDLA